MYVSRWSGHLRMRQIEWDKFWWKMNQILPASEGTQFNSESILNLIQLWKLEISNMFWAGKLIFACQMSTMSGFSYYFPMEIFTCKRVNVIFMKMTGLYTWTWNQKMQFSDILASPSLQISFPPFQIRFFKSVISQEDHLRTDPSLPHQSELSTLCQNNPWRVIHLSSLLILITLPERSLESQPWSSSLQFLQYQSSVHSARTIPGESFNSVHCLIFCNRIILPPIHSISNCFISAHSHVSSPRTVMFHSPRTALIISPHTVYRAVW